MTDCQCGCREQVNGQFAPGHDQRLRVELERRVGGLLALRNIVEAVEQYASGTSSGETLGQVVRRTLWQVNKAG